MMVRKYLETQASLLAQAEQQERSKTELHLITKVDYFQTILKNSKLHFQITDFKYLVARFQFETHTNSYLQFWESIKQSLKLEYCHDQNQYFLSFQHHFYGKSKFQSLSGKHIL